MIITIWETFLRFYAKINWTAALCKIWSTHSALSLSMNEWILIKHDISFSKLIHFAISICCLFNHGVYIFMEYYSLAFLKDRRKTFRIKEKFTEKSRLFCYKNITTHTICKIAGEFPVQSVRHGLYQIAII